MMLLPVLLFRTLQLYLYKRYACNSLGGSLAEVVGGFSHHSARAEPFPWQLQFAERSVPVAWSSITTNR